MWKGLHQLAKPERLYQLCGRLVPGFALTSAAVLLLAWIWGFGYAPADYQQGDSFRIMYIHVPAAMWSMGIYSAMAVAAFTGVVWQMKMADLVSAAMAPIGAVFTFIALVTGSAWGKPMWEPGGYGTPGSHQNWCCCFYIWASLRCIRRSTAIAWPGAPQGCSFWSA